MNKWWAIAATSLMLCLLNPTLAQNVLTLAHQAFIQGYKIAMLVAAGLHLIGLIAASFIKSSPEK